MSDEPARPLTAPAPVSELSPAAPRGAWQPFTFRGVAALARAPYGRLFVVQFLTALLVAASVVWFLGRCYVPVITQAAQKLPEAAGITNGFLTGFKELEISETKFLSIAFTADPEAELDRSADVQVAFRDDRWVVSSLLSSELGSLELPYGPDNHWDLSRAQLEPLWGAWRPVLLVGVGFAVILWLLLLWLALAVVYAPAAKLVAWLFDRELTWAGSWRLAAAALLPGAVMVALALWLYGCQILDVFGLGWLEIVHLLVGWVYLLAAPIFAPRLTSEPMKANPFTA